MKNLRNMSVRQIAVGLGATCLTLTTAYAGELETICGIDNVEDLVALPGTSWIIGSGMGNEKLEDGGLHLIDDANNTARKLELNFSADQSTIPQFDQCPNPPEADKFSAHGLSLIQIDEQKYNLYVVNHGGRESIEVFRVHPTEAEPSLTWVGCVIAPEHASPNSVAARKDGSIVVSSSSFGDETTQADDAFARTGAVHAWHQETGWTLVPDSAFPVNNGIELSADEKWAFVNSWTSSTVNYLPLDPAEGEAQKIALDFMPDNIRYTDNGQLAVTGHIETTEGLSIPEEVGTCFANNDPNCAINYKSALIDPKTLAVTPLFEGTGTKAFGGATTTLKTKNALWMGTFRGNCIAKVPLPAE